MTIGGGGFDMSATLMESKVKSAESTLAFVQEEHRKTLAGLHKEIQDLQLKCSGSTGKKIASWCPHMVDFKLTLSTFSSYSSHHFIIIKQICS